MRILFVPLGLSLVKLLSALPAWVGLIVGKLIGRLIHKIARKRRFVCEKNLQVCFPFRSQGEIQKLTRHCFEENGVGLIETSWAWFRPDEFIIPRVKIEGLEVIREAQTNNRGILLLCPHYSMLDLTAPILYSVVGKFVISYRPNDNPEFDAAIRRGRSRYADLVDVRSLREIATRLRRGDVVWFGPDQDMGPKGSVFAPFFNRLACTVTTPARLARMSGATAIFLDLHRSQITYHAKFLNLGEGYPEENEVANATRLNFLIEQAVRSHPEQYMWMHKRFKTNPDLTRQTLYEVD